MRIIQKSKNGIDYLTATLKNKAQTVTQAWFWKIFHHSGQEEIHFKVGRYKKHIIGQTVESFSPKSELTLDDEEFKSLIEFIASNYEPFKKGTRHYIAVDNSFSSESIENLKAIFSNPNKKQLFDFITKNNIVPSDIIRSLQYQERIKAVDEFENMLANDLVEQKWQEWFKKNNWVLGSEFVKVLDERDLDTQNITDYLMQAYDGFLDIIEIKRPEGDLGFWSAQLDHGNYIPSMALNKAITQATRYLYELERESNSQKFFERVGSIKTIKPRCVLIFGRSNNWNEEQKEAYRILNSCYHNVTTLTYDHVLSRSKRILGIDQQTLEELPTIKIPVTEKVIHVEDIPF